MKNAMFTTGFLFSIIFAAAQDTLVTYFDANWKPTGRSTAEYKRKKFKKAKSWGVIDYYKTGNKQMEGAYDDDSCTIQQGIFSYYNLKGGLYHTLTYLQGKQDGPEVYYYENGQKQAEGNFTNGQYSGDWIGYFESGKVSGKASFVDGKQTAGSFFNEDGSADKVTKVFYRAAAFPGGEKELARYIGSSVVYPGKAEKNSIQGSVVVQFKVTKEGAIREVAVASSVEPSLDKEAMRVIKQMPEWQPCIFGGRPVDTYMKQPITFKLKK